MSGSDNFHLNRFRQMVLPLPQPTAHLHNTDWYVNTQDKFYLLARRMMMITMLGADVGETRHFLFPIMIAQGINYVLQTCHFCCDRTEDNVVITLCCRKI
jgi:hypothetical protein